MTDPKQALEKEKRKKEKRKESNEQTKHSTMIFLNFTLWISHKNTQNKPQKKTQFKVETIMQAPVM